jgi:hypothetical protein
MKYGQQLPFAVPRSNTDFSLWVFGVGLDFGFCRERETAQPEVCATLARPNGFSFIRKE